MMDAFDQVSEEFALTTAPLEPILSTSKRERSPIGELIPNRRMATAQQSVSTKHGPKPIVSTSKRRRQARDRMKSTRRLPAGKQNDQSESHSQADALVVCALGSGSSALGADGASSPITPAAADRSESLQDTDAHSVRALSSDEGALPRCDLQNPRSPLVAEVSDDQVTVETHNPRVIGGNEGAPRPNANPLALSPLVSEIIQLWRMRQRWHRAEKSLILQGKALCRAWTAGDKDAANTLHAKAEKGEYVDPTIVMALMPFLAAQEGFAKERAAIEKRLRKLAQSSDLWPWVAEVKGFGPLNLAALLGEAGEIAAYRNPSCLWKRMGLAVIDGGRQRRVADAEKAILHGYAPARRCVAYLLGDTLIKSGDACRYRPVYTARRERTAETHADWTKAHSHNDAARVMTKRVLRDLWIEARRLQRGDAS